MSEQFKQGDRKIEKVSENRYDISVHDGKEWKHRWNADQEAVSNLLYDVNFTDDTDLKSIGTDKHGNPILRLKK